MDKITIMVIDDEAQMREMIRTFLEEENYDVIEATDGAHAFKLLEKIEPHLIIVDVMMPFIDGFSFTKKLKKTSTVPLIFLSAKGEEWDKVHGLKLGGDDYIVKPFKPMELLARVESLLRRTYGGNMPDDKIIAGPLVIDQQSYEAILDGKPLSLTRREFGLLSTLAQNEGRVYSREDLLQLVWEDNQQNSNRTVDTHVKTLRLKMGDFGHLISTVWGVGYKFEVTE